MMANSPLLKKNLPYLLVVLFASWPFMHLISTNAMFLQTQHFVIITGIIAVMSAIFSGLYIITDRKLGRFWSDRVLLLSLSFLFFVFSYPLWKESLKPLPYTLGYIALMATIFYCLRKKANLEGLFTVILVFIGCISFMPAATLIGMGVQTVSESFEEGYVVPEYQIPAALTLKSKPNVYYIVADGYARHDTLKKVFSYDNQPFLSSLEKNGFYVARQAYANLPATWLSVSSALNMEFSTTDTHPYRYVAPMFKALQGNNATVRFFKNQGYRYIHADPGTWDGSRCSGVEDDCLNSSHFTELFDSIFTLFSITHRSFDFTQLSEQMTSRYNKQPFFLFAHILLPHFPYRFDASCQPTPIQGTPNDGWNKEFMPHYRDQVSCANIMLESLVKDIAARDPDAIVIIHGDHGPGFSVFKKAPQDWTDEIVKERMSILMAIKAPARCNQWLYPELSPVNIFRFTIGCLAHTKPIYLKDEAYLADITARTKLGVQHYPLEKLRALDRKENPR